MSRLHEIPIVVEGAAASCRPAPLGEEPSPAIILALLSEIEAKLETLASHGGESTIDLRCLAGLPREIDLLREILGAGEVSASIANIGDTLAQETAVPCVWWISHRGPNGQPLGEFIEVAEVPELLRSDRRAIPRGLAELRARSALLDASPAG